MKLRTLTILSVLAVILLAVSFAALGEDGNVARVAVLSTTDMHGKCWHTDLLTDAPVTNSMLSVSTAVRGILEAYGGWNILCTGTDMPGSTPRALEFYSGHITTYAVSSSGIYVFNFYEIPGR